MAVFAQQSPDPIPIARKALDLLLSAQYHELHEMFDQQMLQAVSEDTLKTQMASMISGFGTAQKIGDPAVQHVRNLSVVTFPVHFSTADINVVIPVDDSGKVAGLRFSQGTITEVQQKWTPPAYANPAAFHERDVTIGSGEWKLPGTLAMPNGTGPFPAVVLVHGSGPGDRDESVGANKPFRDLADGLASQGIAVVRYDKRTMVYAQQMAQLKDFTVEQETIEDALKAISLLREQQEVDAKRIFVLGLSMGGYLAPRIVERDPQLAGIIIMAGNTRPIQDLVVQQMEYLGSPAEQVKSMQKQADEITHLQNAEGGPLMYAPRSYWLDLNKYHPTADAQKLHCRILILQGGRDYQVTQADYAGWESALHGHTNVTFRQYPALNHLFIAGEGKSLPGEYNKPGHVAAEVVSDIVSWVEKR